MNNILSNVNDYVELCDRQQWICRGTHVPNKMVIKFQNYKMGSFYSFHEF